jgi:hypothetical protein
MIRRFTSLSAGHRIAHMPPVSTLITKRIFNGLRHSRTAAADSASVHFDDPHIPLKFIHSDFSLLPE